MKARALGRFVGEFLEGLAGGKDPAEAEAIAPAPVVVPVEMVRQAVSDFLKPMVEAAAAETDAPPSGEQLDMMFDDARPASRDDIADMTIRRVEEIRAREAERERMARFGEAVPEAYDPNDPASAKPWMAARMAQESIDRNTA